MDGKMKIGLTLIFTILLGVNIALADTQTRYPSGDSLTEWDTSTATAGIHWEDVDEASFDTTTYVQTATNNDDDIYSFSPFTIPANSTISNVTVSIVACDVTSGNNRINAELRVGGTDYLHSTTNTNPGTVCNAYFTYDFQWAQNPKSGSAWTEDDVNGIGANALEGFGINTTDANPNVRVTQVYATVTYTQPTTIGDGVSPSNKNVAQSSTGNAVSAFTLLTSSGTDTVTQVVITRGGSGTDSDTTTNGIKIYQDNNGDSELDGGDLLKGQATFSGGTATISGLNLNVTTTPVQYIITYDITSGATAGNTLTGWVSSITKTSSNTLVNNDNADATLTVFAVTTTIGDGVSPSNKNVAQSSTGNAVSAFTLLTSSGTDTVTQVVITRGGSGTDSDTTTNGIKIYQDNNGDSELDGGDLLKGQATFSGGTATISGLNLNVTTTPAQYIITYDITSGATAGNTLTGWVSSITKTSSNTLVNNDNADATLTVAVAGCTRVAPTFSLGSDKNTTPSGSAIYTLSITNNDSAGCANTTFNINLISETGDTGSFSLPSVLSASQANIAPGATSTSVALTVSGNGTGASGDNITTSVEVRDDANHNGQQQTDSVITTISDFGVVGPGDGNILKRARDETCSACHRTSFNTPSPNETGYIKENWDNAIKMHDSGMLGSCNTSTYVTQEECFANGGTWTAGRWNASSGWGVTGGKYGEFVCTTCHTAHNTRNIYLIAETITTPDNTNFQGRATNSVSIDFRYREAYDTGNPKEGTLGRDNEIRASSSRICEVCHNYDNTQTNGVNQHAYTMASAISHNGASECTGCHDHRGGFKGGGACNSCHGAPPGSGTDNNAPASYASSHIQHYDPAAGGVPTSYIDTSTASTSTAYVFRCGRCHSTNGGDHGTGETNGITNVNLGAGETFTRGAAATNNTPPPGTVTFMNYNSTCSSVYCHGNFTGGTTGNIPTWGVSSSGDCGTCHGATASIPPSGGSHARHVSSGAGQLQLACDRCHEDTTTGSSLASMIYHVNGATDWNLKRTNALFGSSAIYKSSESGTNTPPGNIAYGNCGSVYCHSSVQSGDGTGAPLSYSTPTWGAVSVTCDSCHGQGSGSNDGQPSTGAHEKHVATNIYACSVCHSGHGEDTSTHSNRIINITFNATTAGASASYSRGATITPQSSTFGTCSTTYCHGTAASPAWNGSTTCSSCHSSMGSGTGGVANTGVHLKHTNSSTYIFACENCHDSSQTQHAKGLADAASPQRAAEILYENSGTAGTWLTIQYGGGGTTFNYTRINQSPYGLSAPTPSYAKGAAGTADNGFPWTTGTCGSVWCHSNANPLGGTNSYKTPSWSGTYTLCNDCHSRPADGTRTWSAAHNDHLVTYSANTNFTCNSCHSTVASNNTTISTPSNHVNGAKNISINAWANSSATYNGSYQCLNTYCHSIGIGGTSNSGDTRTVQSNTSTAWNSTIAVCTACHGNPPNYPNNDAAYQNKRNSHTAHSSYTCDKCHYTVTNNGTTIASFSAHVNRLYNVNNQAATMTYTFALDGGTCGTTGCHGAGSPKWGGAALKCSDCHLGTGDTNDYTYDNGTNAMIDTTEWGYSGHGKTSSTYDATGNTAANLPGAAGTGDPCLYCHDGSGVTHGNSTNVFRLRNFSHATFSKNGTCLVCHGTGQTGVDPDGGGPMANKTAGKKIDKYHYGTQHSSTLNGGQFCWDCHDPHGDRTSTNSGPIAMVQLKPAQASDSATGAPTTVTSNNVAFTARSAASDYGSNSAGKVCNVCHTYKAADPNKMLHYYNTTPFTDSHNSGTLCTSCHLHSGNTTYDSKAFSANEDDCKSCHSTSGGVRPIEAEFGRNSHHVNKTWANMTNFDCVVCHAEGQIVSSAVKANSAYHHNPAGTVDLYNADNRATIYSVNLTTLLAKNDAENTKLDIFCMSCHDDTSAGHTKAAGAVGGAGWPADYTAENPFGETTNIRTNAYDAVQKNFTKDGGGLAVYDDFNTPAGGGSSSKDNHHAVVGIRYTTAGTQWLRTNSLLSAAVALYDGSTGVTDSSRLHCNDCHSTAYSSHGGNNEYMLQTAASENPGAEHTGTSQYVCIKCHINGSYTGTGNHVGNNSDYQHSSGQTGAARKTSAPSGMGHMTGISCLNCHDGAIGFGGIHGFTDATYTAGGSGGTYNKRRFMPGSGLRYYDPNSGATGGDADWSTASAANKCYTLSAETSMSSCTKHSGGTNMNKRNIPTRPVDY